MATQVVDVAVQSLGKMKCNIASGMEDILNVVGNLAEGEDSFDLENLDALEEMLIDYVSMERTIEQFTAAVSEVKSQLKDSDVNVKDCKGLLEREFQKKKKDSSDSDPQSHNKVQEFRNRLQELQEGQEEEEDEDEAGPSSIADQSLGEEELVMTQTEVGTKCPFTQQEMMTPVKNTICGHHYEERSIKELFSKKKNFRCPLPGCNNKAFIVRDHLELDEAFKKLLAKQRRANKRKQKFDTVYV